MTMTKKIAAARARVLILLLGMITAPGVCRAADTPFSQPQALAGYDVSWDALGASSADSMPLGNGDIALNVWTEQNGDLLFYISKSDAWTEANTLVKVGRVRVSLSPNPFTPGAPFRQTLRLEDGEIEIVGGAGAGKATLRVWVDADHPVVRVEAAAARPVSMTVTLDPWRIAPVGPVSADVVAPDQNDRITWYHRDDSPHNPALANRTFGATMQGAGLVRGVGNTLRSVTPKTSQRLSVNVLTAATPTVDEWRAQLQALAARTQSAPWDAAWATHQQWWHDFWGRSWMFLGGDADAPGVTEGYVCQRFVTACAGRGANAVKFNGTLFTVDDPTNTTRPKGATADIPDPKDADFRAWGGQYWFQNTRPEYWPLLAEGDFDEMLPLFKQYGEEIKANAPSVKADYGHDGSYMAETAPFWGGIPDIKPGDKGSYTFRYFTPVLEMTAMMLDYYAYTGDTAFVHQTLLPIATAGLTFFAQHFPRDAGGKLLLDPDNAIEMYWDVRDPLPDIAGLHYDLARLLALPPGLVDPATRAQWQDLQKILPPVPVGVKDGKPVLLPYADGQPIAPGHNTENPELYAVYPFRLYGLGKPGLDVALNTFAVRLNKSTGCWYQDPVQAALLGLTDLAKKDVTFNLTRRDPRLRFPAFWERGHDYMPDEDNGGNGELGLQEMLMQCDGGRILLLPAWPAGWTADFKLRAPLNTTVEGHVAAGRVTGLKVTPAGRRADVVIGTASL